MKFHDDYETPKMSVMDISAFATKWVVDLSVFDANKYLSNFILFSLGRFAKI